MKNKYLLLLEELAKAKNELSLVKEELDKTNEDLFNTRNELSIKDKDLFNTRNELSLVKEELDNTKLELSDIRFQLLDAHKRIEELIKEYQNKEERYNKQVLERFGVSSERIKSEDIIINEAEKNKEIRKRKSPTHSFIENLKGLESKTVTRDYDFKANNIKKEDSRYIGKDITYKIEAVPVSFEVVKIETLKYSYNNMILQRLNDDIFSHSPLTPSLAASIIDKKYNLGIPLNRYSDYLKANNLNICKQTLSNWVIRSSDILKPVYERLVNDLINNDVSIIHCDETTIDVIELKEERNKEYMFVYTTSYYDNPIYVYSFNKDRSIDSTINLLKDYKGYLVCDGYVGYDRLKKELPSIKLQRCMVHAERYFKDVYKVLPNKVQKESEAYKVVEKMNKIFKEEKYIRDNLKDEERIIEHRNSPKYKKLIKDLDDYIDSIKPIEGSLLDKAIKYYKKYYEELYTYLNYPYLENQNNIAERVIKPFVVHRRSWLFSNTINGANTSAILYSIVQTAKANGLKSELYLKYLLENINTKPIDYLLPYSNNLPLELIAVKK